MDPTRLSRSETPAHHQLKRLAAVWAQTQGYTACGLEVSLPRCRYRADVAAYRPARRERAIAAILECKQAAPDLRRDNACSEQTRARLTSLQKRRRILEKHLRVHYPTLRTGESLFPEYDNHEFREIGHRTYARVIREVTALQTRLLQALKFERLTRYCCANLFYLVVPQHLHRAEEVPPGWGLLVENDGALEIVERAHWHEMPAEDQLRLLERIAAAGTRQMNKRLAIDHEAIFAGRHGRPGATSIV